MLQGNRHGIRISALLGAILLLASPAWADGGRGQAAKRERKLVVNGQRLAGEALELLSRLEGANPPVPDGRYWYDPVSGLWGREGRPAAGQTYPALPFGGRLRADASGGRSAVFVNGRALHPDEIRMLGQCTEVRPGRYWMNAAGIGGREGLPPEWNLPALCARRSAIRNRGGGDTWYGSVLGGGGVVGGLFGSVGVTCGPDGGCIY